MVYKMVILTWLAVLALIKEHHHYVQKFVFKPTRTFVTVRVLCFSSQQHCLGTRFHYQLKFHTLCTTKTQSNICKGAPTLMSSVSVAHTATQQTSRDKYSITMFILDCYRTNLISIATTAKFTGSN